MSEKWYRLLHEQKYGPGITAKGPAKGGRVGLTPAFVVGAIRVSSGVDSPAGRADLLEMLESMANNTEGTLVHIADCPDMHQPRASLTAGAIGHLGDPVKRSDGSNTNLYASPEYFARDSRDLESLTDGLWNILRQPISEGRYSWRGWQEFDDDERRFIKRALEDVDDV